MNYGVWGLQQGELANISDPASEHMETSSIQEMLCAIRSANTGSSELHRFPFYLTTMNRPIFIVFSLGYGVCA